MKIEKDRETLIPNEELNKVNTKRDFFPNCIVWCPLPLLSWFIPIIGHLGITDSNGIINDFVGPYSINKSKSKMGFGPVVKYYQIDPNKDIKKFSNNPKESLDKAINEAGDIYEGLVHNIITNNCHDHVAHALNSLEFYGSKKWNTMRLTLFMMGKSKFVNIPRFLYTYVVFLVVIGLIIFISIMNS
eukprot:TRINITY_DN1452_c0_g1_i1.p1 TRINITY_DN1452_c0_g1~~TRINITY_DN1452_c0_g1_i1.p1  ORF type:complete len:187 (-),score=29.85 TRINITY_DN1452_c0_g1_i1:32-592(-)